MGRCPSRACPRIRKTLLPLNLPTYLKVALQQSTSPTDHFTLDWDIPPAAPSTFVVYGPSKMLHPSHCRESSHPRFCTDTRCSVNTWKASRLSLSKSSCVVLKLCHHPACLPRHACCGHESPNVIRSSTQRSCVLVSRRKRRDRHMPTGISKCSY